MSTALPRDDHGLILHRDAAAMDRSKEVLRRYRRGDLRRISRGVYSGRDLPTGARGAAEAYREQVLAAGRRMHDPVFTSYSAAALYRLPIVGAWPNEVYVMSATSQGKRRGGVISVARRAEVDHCCVDGLRATSVEFSLIQLARHADLAKVLVAADAAAHVPRATDAAPALTTPEALAEEWHRLLPFRGSRRARAMIERTSIRAESPLETLSRLVMEELGFAPPILQQKFWLPDLGRMAYVDFYWPEVSVIGEADGHGKYLDAGPAAGAAQRVVEEKRREDALRRQVEATARWDWADVWQPRRLEQILLTAGVPRVRRPLLVA